MLYPEKIQSYIKCGCTHNEEFNLEDGIPTEILSNSEFMNLLQVCAKRIDQMQVPRYEFMKIFLIKLMKVFVLNEMQIEVNHKQLEDTSIEAGKTLEDTSIEAEKQLELKNAHEEPEKLDNAFTVQNELTEMEPIVISLSQRIAQFNKYVENLSWNKTRKETLVQAGYNPSLWSDKVELKVKTDGVLNFEENLRQTILSCFNEYCDLLKQLGIPTVIINGAQIKLEDIFTDEYSLTELKGRRAIVVKVSMLKGLFL